MADAEDIQPLVVDNGTGMVKVSECALPVDALLRALSYTKLFVVCLLC